MNSNNHCPGKEVSAKEAISKIKNGSRVFIGTGCGEPQHLIRSMINNAGLQDVMVYQMLSSTLSEYIDDPGFLRRFALKLFFISAVLISATYAIRGIQSSMFSAKGR